MPIFVVVVIILGLLLVICLIYFWLKVNSYKNKVNEKNVILEITPPSKTTKNPESIEQLYTLLHYLGASKRASKASRYSFEIVSTRHDGIRYLVWMPKKFEENFKSQIVSYMHGVKFKKTNDYIKDLSINPRIFEFKQANHFVYPLASHGRLYLHDPIAYLTASMTKMKQKDVASFQLVLTPVFSREASKLRARLMAGHDVKLRKNGLPSLKNILVFILMIPIRLLGALLAVISEVTLSTDNLRDYHENKREFSYRNMTPPVRDGYDDMVDKLSKPLFQVSIRMILAVQDEEKADQIASGISSSLASYHVPGLQGFKRKRSLLAKTREFRAFQFKNRLNGIFITRDSLLSSSEVASLYHFPYGDSSDTTENVIRSSSRTLPAPASIKKQSDNNEFEVVLGVNNHHGSQTAIGLTKEERERHVYIVGGTGNGKTTMLQYAIVQDIKAGRGVAVVDPHGDLAETVIRHIPEDRINDIIYFNPRDLEYPIGLNLLEIPDGLSSSELALEQDFVTEAVISIFRKTFSQDDTGGHRIEFVLRNTIHTAFTIPGATLFTLYDLLTNVDYRNEITKKLKDKRLKQFWDNEFSKAGNMQRVKMASGVTNKLGRFDRSEVVRRVMEQTNSTIDFDDIIQNKKILVCNFSKGTIGEDTAELFGITVLAKIQLAALRRARMSQTERSPFYLYVDEFQHFATHSFLQMLSEARKYKLLLTMAEQSTAQQEEQRMVHVILDNIGTVICFRVRSASEDLLLPIFRPYLDTGEISNLSAFNFYIRINGLDTHEPMSGETMLLESDGSKGISEAVKNASRDNYGVEYKEINDTAKNDNKPVQTNKRKTNKGGNLKGSIKYEKKKKHTTT